MFYDYPVTVAPRESHTINLSVDAFAVIDASRPNFTIRINDRAASSFSQGYKVRAPAGDKITKLRIENDSGDPLHVVIKAGVGDFGDDSALVELDPPPKPLEPVTGREIVKHSGVFSIASSGKTIVIHNTGAGGRAIAVTSVDYYCDEDDISFSRLYGSLEPGYKNVSVGSRGYPRSLFPTDGISEFAGHSYASGYLEGPAAPSGVTIFRLNASDYSSAGRRFDRPILIPINHTLYLAHVVRKNAGLIRAAKFEVDVQFYEVSYTDLHDFV